MLACLLLSVSASVSASVSTSVKKKYGRIASCSDWSVTFQSYGRIHSAYTDHVMILILCTRITYAHTAQDILKRSRFRLIMPKGGIPKVSKESIEAMIELVAATTLVLALSILILLFLNVQ